MADEGSADTFEYTIAGRTMWFLKSSQSQLIMLDRMGRQIRMRIDATEDPDEMRTLLDQMNDMAFETAESRFTSSDDLDFVRREILRGNVELEDVYGILANGNRQSPPDDDADPVPAKKTRKAPAKKAAVKRAPASRRGTR